MPDLEPDGFWQMEPGSAEMRELIRRQTKLDNDAFEAQIRANLAEAARRLQLALGKGIPVKGNTDGTKDENSSR